MAGKVKCGSTHSKKNQTFKEIPPLQKVDTSYEQPIQSIQKLDRTRLWVASQESLTSMGKPHLPPKPQIQPQEPQNNSIPYGYENVLPISQRYVIFKNTSKCN